MLIDGQFELGETATGSIAFPDAAAEPERFAQAEALCAELAARPQRFFAPTAKTVVDTCIDGRRPAAAVQSGPNSAGGSLSLLVAWLLCGGQTAAADFFAILQQAGITLGGHTDNHAHGPSTGCGANDNLPAILAKIAGKELAPTLATGLQQQDRLAANAKTLLDEGQALLADAALRLKAIAATALSEVPELVGAHCEVAVLLNQQAGLTLDRDRLAARFGADVAAFNVDTWAFASSASQALVALNQSGIEMPQPEAPLQQLFVEALTAYNIATAQALCAPSIRVVIV